MNPEMKYQAQINLAEKNSSHTLAYDMVQAHAQGRPLSVLEVGCASGYWGAVLKVAGHAVVGVEPDAQAATAAQKVLDQVFVGLVDDYFAAHPDAKFDVISFVDVLEHTFDPVAVLAESRLRLKPGGIVVASIPNVAHLAVRSMLLAGRWDYAKTGIMDDSHIRFFTRDSIIELFNSGAFRILDFKPTTMCRADAICNYGMHNSALLSCVAWVFAPDRSWRDFQYVVCASTADSAELVAIENSRFAERAGILSASSFKAGVLYRALLLKVKVLLAKGLRR
ncbi:MAG TPA: class I SAM-dependent methyltransferase [Rhodocyclaceae bacterium]|nr:class I SAM-dependent methyltransferase [Rhodocyclaceae bacterium]